MRRLFYTTILIIILSTITLAQSSTNTASRIRNGTADPSTCSTTGSNIFYRTDSGLLKVCTAANTWTSVGGGTITIGTSVIASGTATRLLYETSGNKVGEVSGATSDGTNVTFGSGNLLATLPKITTGLADANGNTEVAFTATGSAVNYLSIANSATGNPTMISTLGSNSDIGIDLSPKGNGQVRFPFGSRSAPGLAFLTTTDRGLYGANGGLHISISGNNVVGFTNDGQNRVAFNVGASVGWSSSSPDSNAIDTGFYRNAAGIIEVNNGTNNTYRDILARGLRSNAVTFANAIASPVEGTLQAFTDSTTATWGATITGGGSNHVLGYFNGTNWTVAGK